MEGFKMASEMYQIIDCETRCVIWEGENLNRAIEKFEFLQGDFEPNTFIQLPDVNILVLQTVERIDRWEREDRWE
jgi:hypothetical protein